MSRATDSQSDASDSPSERRADGTFLPGHSLAAKGSEAAAKRRKFIRQLGLRQISETAEFREYNDAANDWRDYQASELRKKYGDVSNSVATVLANAAIQLAASRYYYDQSVCVERVDPRVELELFVAQKKTSASFMRMANAFAESVNKSLKLAEELASGKSGGGEDDKPGPWGEFGESED